MIDTNVLQITNDVHWIGVLDKDIRTFDIVMETQYGTTYNSYFINADKKAVVEVVKEKFFPVFEAKLRQLCNPEELSYIFINHTEPDHSGGLKKLLEIAPYATVVASNSAIMNLKEQLNIPFQYITATDGYVTDLGNKKITAISAPNLHWPDSIYSYLQEDKVLFTCDSFGAHFCNEEMYNNKVGNYDEAFQYYFDVILKPFSKFFLKAIEKIENLSIDAICTGHGPLLTSNPMETVHKTKYLCEEYLNNYPEKNRILIAFVSAYGYTKKIAEKLKEGVDKVSGITVDFCDIEKMDLATLGEKIAQANAYLLGSPTINQNMLPQLYNLFALMTPLRDRGKLAAAFGAYGWSGEAKQNLISNIDNLKLNRYCESMFVKFIPSPTEEEKIIAFGESFAKAVCGER
ncbi:MAG: FprA family A-type flavoprotein [Bacteroidetes bacterium]|nr:FprA family A-type flavoprotein [Bacteroidota bacterium]MCL1969445.1 FprA family A-type flavoprotein [Bacteroidota bacterium]